MFIVFVMVCSDCDCQGVNVVRLERPARLLLLLQPPAVDPPLNCLLGCLSFMFHADALSLSLYDLIY